ncbi:MAG: hypothetical protein ABIX01_08940 [Chitinophagaceae bacterium]
MKRRLLFLVLLVFAGTKLIHAQDIPAKVKQAKWVTIMNADSLYNYFEAEADFQKFYAGYLKEKKKEERRRERSNAASPQEEHLESPVELLVADYVKWTVQIQPFVRADGSIMPLAERLVIARSIKNGQQAQQ